MDLDFTTYKRASHTFVETFFSMDDAVRWLDGHKNDHDPEVWEIVEERVNLIGGGYRTGIVFVKRQVELNFED